jgi:uncharacterized membrane protein YfcA
MLPDGIVTDDVLGLAVAIVFGGSLIRATWGFGDTVFALPLLTLVISLKTAAPTLVLVSSILSLLLLRERPNLVDWGVVGRVLIASLLGIPIGLHVLHAVPELVARRSLGVLLSLFALGSLARTMRPAATGTPDSPPSVAALAVLDLIAGTVAGACNAAYDIPGPILLIHGTLHRWTSDQLRMNLQATLLPLAVLTMIGHAASGLWSPEVLVLSACCLPGAALASHLGVWLRERLAGRKGLLALYSFVLALGVMLVLRSDT